MCGKVFIKRVLPFFLTFSVGLFIASFFVTIAAPTFQFNRGWRKHQQYHRMMESQIQRVNEENVRLKKQLADKETENSSDQDFDLNSAVPPPTMLSPAKARTIPYNGR